MVYKCKMCKGDLVIINEENGLCECDSCGSRQTVPLENDERKAEFYNRANQYRKSNLFDRAAGVYEDMVKEFPDEAEAYWGLVLCHYGIEYVKDPRTGTMIPTCHRTIPKTIFEDSDYQLACQKAKPLARAQHEAEAAEIDRLQKKIFQLAQREDPFDVFISYKELDDMTGERTEDSVIAQDIYSRLTSEGYKVFFSRITLENRLGEDYEPIIYSALRSSKIMLLIGTSREHMNAPWVRNEWTRYLDMMDAEEHTKTLIPVYAKMDPYDIPQEINGRHLQAQDATKIGFQQDLLHGIRKILSSSREKVAPVSTAGMGNTNTAGMVERGFICLKDGNFKEAGEVFNQILNIDPHSGAAYLGRLMIRRNVRDIDDLGNQTTAFSEESDYQHVLDFGEPKIKKKLKEFNQKIIEGNRFFAGSAVDARTERLTQAARGERGMILNLEGDIHGLMDQIASHRDLMEKNDKAEHGGQIASYIVIGLYIWYVFTGIVGTMQNDGLLALILASVVYWLVYRYIIGLFVVPVVRKITCKCMGKPREDILSSVQAEIGQAQQMIEVKNNEIQKHMEDAQWLEDQVEKLKQNRDALVERLAVIDRDNIVGYLSSLNL